MVSLTICRDIDAYRLCTYSCTPIFLCLRRLNLSSSTRIRGTRPFYRTWRSMFWPIMCHYSPNRPSSMMSRHMYDNTGSEYNVSRILTAQATIDEAAYKGYSPLFISYVVVLLSFFPHGPVDCSATFAVAYGMSFASITATLVHAALYFRRQIWLQVGRSLGEQPDVHARLMSRYPQGLFSYGGCRLLV